MATIKAAVTDHAVRNVLSSAEPVIEPGTWVTEVRDPEAGTLIATVPRAARSDVQAAVSRATAAAESARRMPAHSRMAILDRAAEIVTERNEDFARTIAREGVKTIREARREAARCAETLRLCAEEARHLDGETVGFAQRPGSENRLGYWFREPLDVLAALTPFNDPLHLVTPKLGPAIAAGNPAIVKPHSANPLNPLRLHDALHEAG